MPHYPFMQVDAFTDHALGGNPCAVIFEADDLDDATRLAIARENNLSETAFVVRSDIADFGARYSLRPKKSRWPVVPPSPPSSR